MHATYQQSWACGTAQGGRHVGVVPRAGRGSAVDTWQCQCRRCTRRGAAPAAAPLTHLLQELHTLLAEVREGLHEVLVQGVVPASAGSSHGVGSLSERRRRALRTSGGRTRASALTATARNLHRGSATVFRWDVAAVPSLHFASAAEIGHALTRHLTSPAAPRQLAPARHIPQPTSSAHFHAPAPAAPASTCAPNAHALLAPCSSSCPSPPWQQLGAPPALPRHSRAQLRLCAPSTPHLRQHAWTRCRCLAPARPAQCRSSLGMGACAKHANTRATTPAPGAASAACWPSPQHT